jgi:hypothetical protein
MIYVKAQAVALLFSLLQSRYRIDPRVWSLDVDSVDGCIKSELIEFRQHRSFVGCIVVDEGL